MDIKILCEKFCDFSVSIRGYSKATIRRYEYVINCFCKFTGTNDLNAVSERMIRDLFFYGRSRRKWTVHTYIVYRNTLMVFFTWCVNNGYMQKNPVADIEIPKAEKKLPAKLTKSDALRLLEIVYNYPYESKFLRCRNHAIFSTFIFAGVRKQELLSLKYTDVDTENLTIFVRQGKGNKDRVLPISYTLAQSLKRYSDERRKLSKTCPEFFVSSNRNQGYTNSGLKRLVTQLSKASGITFTVHKLRHTFATLMLEGGCDIYSLSKMMGHSDIKTTTIYLSASVEHLRMEMTKHPMNETVLFRS
jgi:site-specific recombinase XerD